MYKKEVLYFLNGIQRLSWWDPIRQQNVRRAVQASSDGEACVSAQCSFTTYVHALPKNSAFKFRRQGAAMDREGPSLLFAP